MLGLEYKINLRVMKEKECQKIIRGFWVNLKDGNASQFGKEKKKHRKRDGLGKEVLHT